MGAIRHEDYDRIAFSKELFLVHDVDAAVAEIIRRTFRRS
jgi:hypothetical protein